MSDPYVSGLVHPEIPVNSEQKVTMTLTSTAAQQLTPTRRRTKTVNLAGFKGNNTPNGASVYFGFDSSTQVFEIAAGTSVPVDGDWRGWDNDLSKIWVRGTAGDGIVAIFQEGVE